MEFLSDNCLIFILKKGSSLIYDEYNIEDGKFESTEIIENLASYELGKLVFKKINHFTLGSMQPSLILTLSVIFSQI